MCVLNISGQVNNYRPTLFFTIFVHIRVPSTLPEPSPWPSRITEPGSATGDCDHHGRVYYMVIMYFQIKVRKRFMGDILHIVILDFSADILTLSVKVWSPGLVQ